MTSMEANNLASAPMYVYQLNIGGGHSVAVCSGWKMLRE